MLRRGLPAFLVGVIWEVAPRRRAGRWVTDQQSPFPSWKKMRLQRIKGSIFWRPVLHQVDQLRFRTITPTKIPAMLSALIVLASTLLVGHVQAATTPCTATINSLSDVSAAEKCTTVNINGFTVPAGEGFTLSLAENTVVNLNGDILFGNKSWAGPLFTVSGDNIVCE